MEPSVNILVPESTSSDAFKTTSGLTGPHRSSRAHPPTEEEEEEDVKMTDVIIPSHHLLFWHVAPGHSWMEMSEKTQDGGGGQGTGGVSDGVPLPPSS